MRSTVQDSIPPGPAFGESGSSSFLLLYESWPSPFVSFLSNHSKLLYHQESLQDADVLLDKIQMPASRIDVMCTNSLWSRMAENSHIFHQIVRAVLFLSKQGLALRVNIVNVSTTNNPGNCLALLRMFAETDNVLHNHLQQPRARNATYILPTT